MAVALAVCTLPTLTTLATGDEPPDRSPITPPGRPQPADSPAEAQPPESEESLLCRSRVKLHKIGLGLHTYHDKHGEFPAAATVPPGGTHLVSWRVVLLPYLGHEQLYREYRMNEAWDSEHNRRLIEKIPDVYVTPTSKPLPKGRTSYVAPVSDVTLFPASGPRGIQDCRDGTANTLLLVEADTKHSVPWTKPEDLTFDEADPFKGLIGHRRNSFVAMFADGATAVIPRPLVTRDGMALGEQRSREILLNLFVPDDGRAIPVLDIAYGLVGLGEP
ncbi:MAG TPA: DUF1559 domain-containing protein [Planctomycetaceae bacterium]|nr:DUF1559 domain-containing protein [Planctomycetaceae bacterium]